MDQPLPTSARGGAYALFASAWGGVAFAIGWGLGLWAVDSALLAGAGVSAWQWLERSSVVWALTGVTVLLFSVVGGLGTALFALPIRNGVDDPPRSAWQHVHDALFDGGVGGSALLLTLCWDALLLGLASRSVAGSVIKGMHQTRFMVLAIAGLVPVVAAIVLALHAPTYGLVLRLLSACSRVPLLGGLLRRPKLLASALVLLAVGLAGSVVRVQWQTAQYLPWRSVGQACAALVAGGIAAGLRARLRSKRVLRVGIVALCAVTVAATIVAFKVDPEQSDSVYVARTETLSGRMGMAVLGLADTDGDGYLPYVGGDCAPRNKRIHPGAIEIMRNGIDEDCDGKDLTHAPQIARRRYGFAVPESITPPQQIFLITIDALQWSRLFAKDTPKPVTPNLDALARRSVYFSSAFSAGPSTRNAFPSIFTSRWECQMERVPGGKSPHGIADSEVMLAETMQAAEYKTLAVLPNVYFFPRTWHGFTDGFENIIETPGTSRARGGILNASVVAEEAMAALAEYPSDGKLFAWIHFFDAHTPLHKSHNEGIGPWGNDWQSVYNSEVEFVDQQLGVLLKAIDDHAFSDPLIVITADHGLRFAEEVGAYKDLSTETLHIPLIFYSSTLVPRRVDTIVSTMDIAPTLVNLIRLPKHQRYEGVSLVPELTTGQSEVTRYLHHEMWMQERVVNETGDPIARVSMRSERYHLIQDRDNNRWAMFDWRADPLEERDLINEPTSQPARKRLQEIMLGLMSEVCLK